MTCAICGEAVRYSTAYAVWMHLVTDAVTEGHRATIHDPGEVWCGRCPAMATTTSPDGEPVCGDCAYKLTASGWRRSA